MRTPPAHEDFHSPSIHHNNTLRTNHHPTMFSKVAPLIRPLTATAYRYASSSAARPFRVLGVQQIAIGSESREGLQGLWQKIFGFEPKASMKIESENVEEDILQLGPEPYSVEVDLMTPIDPEKSPKVHKPPLNHIGLWVDDLPAAVDWMKEQGVRFTPGGIRPGASGHDVTFIHPKGNEESPICGNGVLVELVQAPEAVIKAMGGISNT